MQKFTLLVSALFAFGSALSHATDLTSHETLNADEQATVQALRTNCQACHAVGNLRFIYSSDDGQVWNYILTTDVPGETQTWAQAMVPVLSWPTDSAPPFNAVMDPTDGKDWMPQGYQRIPFSTDTIGSGYTDEPGTLTRHLILDTLNQALGN